MSANIYYVGRSPQNSSRNNYYSPAIRQTGFTKQRLRREYLSPSPQSQSRSTSCPKTQRSVYMQTRQHLRKMSPAYRYNVTQIRKALQINHIRLEQNLQKRKTINSHQQGDESKSNNKSKMSSAFQIVKTRPVDHNECLKERKIMFKKVEQPMKKEKHVHWKLENGPEQENRYKNFVNFPNKQVLPQIQYFKEIPMKTTNLHKIDSNIQLTQISKEQQQILEYFKIQPMRKLFLCKRCYQFTPTYQLKSHHLACKIPLKKGQFIVKWHKLIFLLQQCFREQQSNQIYRLFDRMKAYIADCDVGKRQGYILYSEQLACILSLKGKIQIRCLWEEDLFWLIQNLGDLIETKPLELDQTAFWKICT